MMMHSSVNLHEMSTGWLYHLYFEKLVEYKCLKRKAKYVETLLARFTSRFVIVITNDGVYSL